MGQEACPSLLSASGQRWGRSPWVHAGAGRGGWGPLTSSSPLPAQGWAPPAGGDAPAESRRVALGARWGLRTPRRAWLLGSGGRLPGLREVGGVRPWVRLLEVGASKAWAGACPPPPPWKGPAAPPPSACVRARPGKASSVVCGFCWESALLFQPSQGSGGDDDHPRPLASRGCVRAGSASEIPAKPVVSHLSRGRSSLGAAAARVLWPLEEERREGLRGSAAR